MANGENAVGARLEADRRDLLDLSLRNPLLNYRPRALGLEIVGESPVQLFRALVKEGKRVSFLPAPEPSPTPDPEEPAGPAEGAAMPLSSSTDSRLQTSLPADRLQARLLATYYAARTSMEEQGVNTLFLALGMLLWAEDDDAARLLRAPLILVPVELERTSVRERFRIRATDEDLEVNLSLAEKLKAEFGITLPDFPDADELDVGRYFDDVTAAVGDRPGFAVEREVVLAFFSFGKFLMYRDLDETLWPDASKPSRHPTVRALLGAEFDTNPQDLDEDAALDTRLKPDEPTLVVDADSTQVLAILDVENGRNQVIQGPPGTGKSQTITNLIAGAIERNLRVLFVSEKMAALEVVKRRLDAVGLGDACLELHSQKTNKKVVLDELRRTLGLGKPRVGPIADDLRLLGETRDRLNAYCEAVNTPIGASGITPFHAFGALLELKEPETFRPIEIPTIGAWSSYDLRRRQGLVEELQARLAAVGLPCEHPFWGAQRRVLLPSEGERLRDLLLAARRATEAVREAVARLARVLRLAPAASRGECERLLRAARRFEKAGQLHGADVASPDWLKHRGDLHELFRDGEALVRLQKEHAGTLLPDAWDRDLSETRRTLNALGRSWWRFFSRTYGRASRELAALCRSAPPARLDDQLALIDAIHDARRHRETLRRHDALAARLFGERWQGEHSNWSALAGVEKWAVQLHHDLRDRRIPAEVLGLLQEDPAIDDLEPLIASVKSALAAQADRVRQVTGFLEFDPAARFGEAVEFEDRPFSEQEEQLGRWLERIDDLPSLVAFNRLAGRCREEELGPVVSVAETWPAGARQLVGAFRRHWLETLLRRSFAERPALAGFDGPGHEHAIRTFGDLDRLLLRHNRARLAAEHWKRLPRHEGGGQLSILRREFEKKARHLPVRQLMSRAGNAIQAIKPVFMMSPLSIAAFLAPGSLEFDLVVFDEASQVKPVDALGALLRGRQAVIVGDSRQLPPTPFFDRLTGDDPGDDEEDSSGSVESILGLFVAQGAPERMLRWHYRSRHESLIAVSNQEFYGGRLLVFPSPDAGRSRAGLVLRHLAATTYDRGKTRTNPGEAEAVARAVLAHAAEQLNRPPDQRLTLGVAAFSMPQREAIQEHVERLRRDDPSCEEFFAPGTPEPFFIKNLENVQGDERDVMFISIGYGRTAGGDVPMNFGPLNGEGGERRLNVLMTRARRRCEVFTNMTAADLDLERTRARGVRALKTFLAYAEGGSLDPPVGGAEPLDAPFEASVQAALRAAGYAVRPHSGMIDLAVRAPGGAQVDLLGITCDGPTYHEAGTARDRDRLRGTMLEALGWRLQPVWSTDWVRDPAGASRRLLARLDALRKAIPEPSGPKPPVADLYEREAPGEPGAPAPEIPRYRQATLPDLANTDLGTIAPQRLTAAVVAVVNAESPVHVDELARRLSDAAGVKRLTSRTLAVIERACAGAIEQGKVRQDGDFLWDVAQAKPLVRDRNQLPASSRRIELIAPEELALAVEQVVADALGIERTALPFAVCRLLGFNRMTDEMRTRLDSVIQDLIETRRLVPRGESLLVPEVRQESA
jgi:hypothetical protein